ncbi:hypothetical protein E4U41_000095 [Claviceps citrina]|nr:hypothetical protein E4U41_000095 [Claviceps citrina]
MSQQLPPPGASYLPQSFSPSPSHPTFGHSIYGYQNHRQTQQPRHHLQQRQPPQLHEIPSGHASSQPSTHPHSLAQHVQARGSHGLLQHHFQSPQMPPPPAHMSRQENAQQNHLGPAGPTTSAKHAGSHTLMMPPLSKIDEASGRKYQLDVVQQPKRARMCGFGDKDRRPITPPPCVRLIITDIATGKEIDCSDIDHSMFVLNVDLWSEDGSKEVNLVRSSTGSPSITSTVPYSYTTLNAGETGMFPYTQHVLPSNRDAAFSQPQGVGFVQDYPTQPSYGQGPAYPSNGSYGPPQQFFPHHQTYRSDGGANALPSQSSVSPFHRHSTCSTPSYIQDHGSLARMAMVGGQPQGMFTRNLIGSLAASAFRLSDTEDRIGIWFVLQDLSVRTEGPFRLRFSFVNVGPPDSAPRDAGAPKINKSRAPILACCFSEVFNVFSAKKFPGVCESTPLSKTFATQGIKIPIRKDANVKGGEDDDYGD